MLLRKHLVRATHHLLPPSVRVLHSHTPWLHVVRVRCLSLLAANSTAANPLATRVLGILEGKVPARAPPFDHVPRFVFRARKDEKNAGSLQSRCLDVFNAPTPAACDHVLAEMYSGNHATLPLRSTLLVVQACGAVGMLPRGLDVIEDIVRDGQNESKLITVNLFSTLLSAKRDDLASLVSFRRLRRHL